MANPFRWFFGPFVTRDPERPWSLMVLAWIHLVAFVLYVALSLLLVPIAIVPGDDVGAVFGVILLLTLMLFVAPLVPPVFALRAAIQGSRRGWRWTLGIYGAVLGLSLLLLVAELWLIWPALYSVAAIIVVSLPSVRRYCTGKR